VIVRECNSGIDADKDDGLRIRECDFTGFGVGTGIDAFEVSNLSIENNSFTLYLNGMSLRYSDGPYIFGNSLVSNLDNGIILEQFENGLVRNNHIENHASNGIRINYGTDIELEDNTIHNITGKGVSVTWTDFVMRTTTIEEAGYGVYFQDISNGEIYNCSIFG
jgi:parallel beta-helix repeat protein